MKRQVFEVRSLHAAVRNLAAPAKWRGMRKQWLKVVAAHDRFMTKTYKAAKKSKHPVSTWNGALVAGDSLRQLRKLDARFNDAGVTSCAINRSR
jgi:hypothetical protein